MFGYDWMRLHAVLNDLPVALLLAAVIFDLIGAVAKRESLKAAGLWCLIGGVVGGLLAAVSGLMAESRAPHDDVALTLMETHQTFAIVVLVLFSLLLVWRIVRRGILGKQEQTIFTTAAVVATGLLIFTAKLGGNLVFDHAMGIDSHVLQDQIESRRRDHEPDAGVVPASVPADTAAARRDSADRR